MVLSRLRSATRLRSLRFSSRSCFSRSSLTPMPPNFLFQRQNESLPYFHLPADLRDRCASLSLPQCHCNLLFRKAALPHRRLLRASRHVQVRPKVSSKCESPRISFRVEGHKGRMRSIRGSVRRSEWLGTAESAIELTPRRTSHILYSTEEELWYAGLSVVWAASP